jgi:hypothetical protein
MCTKIINACTTYQNNLRMAVFWVVPRSVVWYKFADVSEVLAASIVRATSDGGGSGHL